MAFLSWCAHRLALRFFCVQFLALLTTLFTSVSLRSSVNSQFSDERLSLSLASMYVSDTAMLSEITT